ncbi:MAG: hypothetical protein A3J53_02595 [Candidatus Harrisonbacteria bacterium RIFCSPHIGHO2_02_FULL_40_20]|nr:MAG: hypothetical protein A3J53_02595 [Candidatus Harrisonbacteria bacterium RIFCSPHIGHO2_02_FULL_40_20]
MGSKIKLMIRITNSRFYNKKGFTLIEMLIVISIIGILASIVLVGLGAFRSRGRDTRRIADLREAQGALELYYTKFQQYPSSGLNSWGTMSQAIINGGVGVNTVSNDPLSPAKTYVYGASSDQQQYVLMATLEEASHPGLKDDVDGTVFGVNCGDAPQGNYCVRL